MMRRVLICIACVALLVLLAGCASPPSHFYTLSAGSVPSSAVRADLSVAVGPVSVPASVDRPEIVVTEGPNQVRLEEYDRWASPLQDEISRSVAENLVAMLGTPHVTQTPQTATAEARFRVMIEVQRFVSAPGQSAELDAVWTIRRVKDDRSKTGRTSIREPVVEAGYDALAAAHSRAVARLSQDIADAVLALAHGGH